MPARDMGGKNSTQDACLPTLLQAKPLLIHSGIVETPGIFVVYSRGDTKNVDKTPTCLQEKAHRGQKSNKNVNTNDV